MAGHNHTSAEGQRPHSTHAAHEEHSGHAGHEPVEHLRHAPLSADVYAGEEVALHGSPQAAQAAGHAAHGAHAGHSPEMCRRPFWISLLLTIPILIYAELFQQLFGYTAPRFPGADLLPFVLGSVIYWYGGWVFLRGAVDELRGRQPGMMTLVAMAITVAYVYSVAVTFGIVAGMACYWELATLVTVMLAGHWMEMRAVGAAQSALNELARLLPDTAWRALRCSRPSRWPT